MEDELLFASSSTRNLMQRMRNITVCVPEPMDRRARVYAAQHGISLPAAVPFLRENLSAISRAVSRILEEDSSFGNTAASARSSMPLAADEKCDFGAVKL